MLTLFAIPKPFVGEAALHQRNALESWARLGPAVEILLCGDDEGVEAYAARLGARHLPSIDRNEYGTPLLDSAFRQAAGLARAPLLCYANADLILLDDLVAAARRIPFPEFLVSGRRWTVRMREPVDFERPDWQARLRDRARRRGRLDQPFASDYFILSRDGPMVELPPFAVGRPAWDNWMFRRARELRIPLVDATGAITAIHPRHGHERVPARTRGSWEGPEADANRALLGARSFRFQLGDATHVLDARGVRPARRLEHRARRRRVRKALDELAGGDGG